MARTDLEQLVFSMSADVRGLKSSLDKANGEIDRGARSAERRFGQMSRTVEKSFGDIRLPKGLAREWNDLGRGIGENLRRGSTAAQVALAGVSAYAIKLAMDAGEIESAFDVAFKGAAKGARAFSDTLAGKVGRDAVETREAMTRLQLVLTGTGVAAETAAAMTEKLSEVGIDAGSLFNTSDAVAFQKIISGLTGEAEPLKAFGVVINDAAVKTELLRLGFKGTTQDASESAKSVARANLIIKGLAVAQGDATRTAGSAANQTRAMRAELTKAARELGEQLLPEFVKLTSGARDTLHAFNDLPSGVQVAGLAFLGLIAAGGPIAGLLANLGKVIKLAKDTRAAIAGIAAANAVAGGSGVAAGVVGGSAAGLGGASGAGLAAGAVGAPLAVAGFGAFEIVQGAKYQQTVKEVQKATDAAIAGSVASARAQIEAAAKGGAAGQPVVARLSKDLATLTAEQLRRAAAPVAAAAAGGAAAAADPSVAPVGGFTLTGDQLKPVGGKPKKAKKGPATPRDLNDEQSAQLAAQIAAADREVLQARLGLAVNAEDRAALEKKIVEATRQQEDARLSGQIAAINDPKNKGLSDAKKAELTAALAALRLKNNEVAGLQAQAIEREQVDRVAQEQLQTRQTELDAQLELLQLQDSLAGTAKERRAIELRLLDLADQRERLELEAVKASETATAADKAIAQAKLDQLAATRGGREQLVRQGTAGPVEQFISDHRDPARAAERFESITVGAFDSLSSGLASAIANADSLGAVAKNVFRQMAADLLAAAIRKDIAAPLLAMIPGFAGGTNFAPGGLAMVGEKGRELVNLPRGSQVVPHSQTLSALKNLSAPQAAQSVTVLQPFHFHAENAVMTSELLGQANAQAAQYANSAYVRSLRDGRKGLPDALRAHQQLRG